MPAEEPINTDLVRDFWNPIYAFLRADGRNHDEASAGLCRFFQAWNDNHTVPRLRTSVLAKLTTLNPSEFEGTDSATEYDLEWCRRRFDSWPEIVGPTQLFDCEWADVLVQKCMHKVELEYVRRGRAKEFRILSRTVRGRQIPPRELAHMLKQSGSEAQRALQQLRHRLRLAFSAQVAETAVEGEFDTELQHVSALAPGVFQ